jgi:putative molybdopterin biosynthesis protein
LIVQPGNPGELEGLGDLARAGLRFVNRQPGAGTRVWLDAQLHRRGIDPAQINGYGDQVFTHSEVARAVGEQRADTGLGIEAAALSYGLDFVFLTSERYDLVVPAEVWDTPPMQAVIDWLATEQARADIAQLGGYDVHATGQFDWVG